MEAKNTTNCQPSQWPNFKDFFFELKNSKDWPNSKTACSLISTAANVACEVLKSSFQCTFRCNAPIRIFSIILHHEDYPKMALEVTALVTLIALAVLSTPATSAALVSFSRYIMIALDLTPELLHIFHLIPHKNENTPQETPPQETLPLIPQEEPLVILPLNGPQVIIPEETKKNAAPLITARTQAMQFLKLTEQESNDLAIVKEHYIKIAKELKSA